MIAAILAAISSVFGVFKGVLDRWFPPKTAEEIERERLEDVKKDQMERAYERAEAIKAAKSGRTGAIERILNRYRK